MAIPLAMRWGQKVPRQSSADRTVLCNTLVIKSEPETRSGAKAFSEAASTMMESQFMLKDYRSEMRGEQRARFRAEVERLINAGVLNAAEAGDALYSLVARAAVQAR
jgi:hypothetical protein